MTEDEAKRAAMDGDWETVARYVVRRGLARHCVCQEGVWFTVRVHDEGPIAEQDGAIISSTSRYKIEQLVVVDGMLIDGQWQTAPDPWHAEFQASLCFSAAIPRIYQHQLDGCMGDRYLPTFSDEDAQMLQDAKRDALVRRKARSWYDGPPLTP